LAPTQPNHSPLRIDAPSPHPGPDQPIPLPPLLFFPPLGPFTNQDWSNPERSASGEGLGARQSRSGTLLSASGSWLPPRVDEAVMVIRIFDGQRGSRDAQRTRAIQHDSQLFGSRAA
jgi:hypothetical protein